MKGQAGDFAAVDGRMNGEAAAVLGGVVEPERLKQRAEVLHGDRFRI